jgi:tetratricopeptide (TPR) repeat protein
MNYYLLQTILLGVLITTTEVLPVQALITQTPKLAAEIAGDSLESLVASAQNKIKKGDYQGARLDLNRAIELSPQDPKLFILRGVVYASLERYERAIQDYDEAIKLDPRNTLFYNLRAEAYWNIRQYQAAISNYTQVIALNPKSTKAYIKRGSAYQAIEDGKNALADFNQAVALDPQDAEAYHSRGGLYANSFYGAKSESSAGTILFFLGNPAEEVKQKALSDYDRAIKLDSKVALYYYNRGILHSAIFRSFANNVFRIFDRNAEKQRAVTDLQMAAKLFVDAGQSNYAQAANDAIKKLESY